MKDQKKRIGYYYHHVDNGGIEVSIHEEEDTIEIVTKTQYYGYPSVSSSLSIHTAVVDTATLLEKIGTMFLDAAKTTKPKLRIV